MKNKFFTIILAITLLIPNIVQASNVPEIDLIDSLNKEDFVNNNNLEDIPNIETVQKVEEPEQKVQVKNELETKDFYKQPVSIKKILKKFLLAMFGVGISAILLFIFLKLYKGVRSVNSNSSIDNLPPAVKETPLATPDDINSAIKIFLDKTKWEN